MKLTIDNIQLIIEPRLDAGSVKSADVLIIADFKKPKEINFQYPLRKFKRANQKKKGGEDPVKEIEIEVKKVFLKNFICSVEVKNSSKSRSLKQRATLRAATFASGSGFDWMLLSAV